MAPYREVQLREIADPPTLKILDQWRSLSTQTLGRPLEVVTENRRRYPRPSNFDGEANFARPAGYQRQVVLSVWLDKFPDYNPVLLTHEVGHWILNFSGFRGLLGQPHGTLAEVLLNSMTHHPPLYALQRSVGIDPQTEIASRCDHDIEICSRSGKEDPLASALLVSDDLLNCNWKKRRRLEYVLRKHRPKTMALVTTITDTVAAYDLSDPQANLAFSKALVKKLKMPEQWIEHDNVQATKDLILEIEGR